MPAPCVVQAGGTTIEGVSTYVIGVSHDSDASVRDVQRVLRKLKPTTICLELPAVENVDPMLAEYRSFAAGEGSFSLSRWFGLYRHGFRSAALDRWVGKRTDHFTEYRAVLARAAAGPGANADSFSDHTGKEMTAAIKEATRLGATIERIDAPAEISSARAWNQKDIVSNLWGLGMRWSRTVPKASCPPEWKLEPPQGWEEYRAGCDTLVATYDLRLPGERNRLALAVGGAVPAAGGDSPDEEAAPSKGEGARQIFQGTDQRVWLYERDLILADNLFRVSTALGRKQQGVSGRAQRQQQRQIGRRAGGGKPPERVIVGIVGLAHIPGIVANWGHSVDCSATKVGGLLHPKSHLPWQKRALLAGAMLSVAVTMYLGNRWITDYRDEHFPGGFKSILSRSAQPEEQKS